MCLQYDSAPMHSGSAPVSAVAIESLSHRYGERPALQAVSISVARGEIFGLLGPNGCGKTTLFRILCTLIPPQSGCVRIFGQDLAYAALAVRRKIGVVFQAPSLDKKLTAAENLRHQGHLYGLRGKELSQRIDELLARVGLADRANERTEKLSGGQRRRVELAKGLLHRPALLLLDEPSTGLDPGARRELMQHLQDLSARDGVTSVLTTHLLEEAEACSRLAILNQGRLVALDAPAALKARIGGDVITVESGDATSLCEQIKTRFGGAPVLVDNRVRIERADGHRFVAQLAEAFPGQIESISVGKPTLEDVFIQSTGHRFWVEGQASSNGA